MRHRRWVVLAAVAALWIALAALAPAWVQNHDPVVRTAAAASRSRLFVYSPVVAGWRRKL